MKPLYLPLLLAAALAGCSVSPAKPDASQVATLKTAAAAQTRPSLVARQHEQLSAVLEKLTGVTGDIYILDARDVELTVASRPIYSLDDLGAYLRALGYTVETSGDNGYVTVKVRKGGVPRETQPCRAVLTGTMPLGIAVSEVCAQAGLSCRYADAGASSVAAALYSVTYSGNCTGALDHVLTKAGLFASVDDGQVNIRMFDTASIALNLPARDRTLAATVLAAGGPSGPNGTSGGLNSTAAGAQTTGATPGMAGQQNGRQSRSQYVTSYAKTIRDLLEQSLSDYGSYSYVPETGLLSIRDKREAVEALRGTLTKLAASFYAQYDITLTFYRVTTTDAVEIGGNLTRAINERLALGSTALFLGNAAGKAAGALTWTGGTSSYTLQVLQELGEVETLESYDLNVQANIPATLKVGANIDYVRNITTTQTAVATGTTSSSIEQATVNDGAYITVLARPGDGNKISVDLHAYINQFDRFDTVETNGSTVRSPRTYERTFDTTPLLTDGVPYVVASLAQSSYTRKESGVPGLSSAAWLMGSDSKTAAKTHIVAVVQARRQ